MFVQLIEISFLTENSQGFVGNDKLIAILLHDRRDVEPVWPIFHSHRQPVCCFFHPLFPFFLAFGSSGIRFVSLSVVFYKPLQRFDDLLSLRVVTGRILPPASASSQKSWVASDCSVFRVEVSQIANPFSVSCWPQCPDKVLLDCQSFGLALYGHGGPYYQSLFRMPCFVVGEAEPTFPQAP